MSELDHADLPEPDKAALEAFVVENRELEELEDLLASFNLFEAIGVVNQELKHSNFLAFLLDPTETHGLGELFLKLFLTRVLSEADSPPFSPIEVDVADLRSAQVRREWRNIDVLIVCPESRLVCAIENKVGTGEHSNQLARYERTIDTEFPGFRKLCIYLTPDGDSASNETWLPTTYGCVVSVAEKLVETLGTSIGSDLETTLLHYCNMVKRRIMADSEIQRLCEKIYQRHKRALDLLFEYRPDLQSDLAVVLKELHAASAKEHALGAIYWNGKKHIEFGHASFDEVQSSLRQRGWEVGEILGLELVNDSSSIDIVVRIVPCPRRVQTALYEFAKSRPDTFRPHNRLLKKYTPILVRRILHPRDYEDPDLDVLREKIVRGWDKFLREDLVRVSKALKEFEAPAPEEV